MGHWIHIKDGVKCPAMAFSPGVSGSVSSLKHISDPFKWARPVPKSAVRFRVHFKAEFWGSLLSCGLLQTPFTAPTEINTSYEEGGCQNSLQWSLISRIVPQPCSLRSLYLTRSLKATIPLISLLLVVSHFHCRCYEWYHCIKVGSYEVSKR